jgi:predicted ATPase/DNA-binding CsgD family transcriptional regulator
MATTDLTHQTISLPRPLTTFIGRERETAQVVDRLRREDVRLLTLTGPGGVGKTRLAIRVAEAIAAEYPDGVWFVPLAAVRDPELVASTIARTLEVPESGDYPIAERIAAFLADRHGLLVVDNFEHVLEAGPVLTDLLSACSGLTVLVTSRTVLRLSGEHDVAVPPLSLPRQGDVSALTPDMAESIVEPSEAVRLFVARATAADTEFALTADNAADVAALCARLDGLPLAIELAAARVPTLPPQAMLRRLDRRLRLLTGGARDQPLRLRSMRDAIAWSHDLLSAEEQILFRRVAVFAGSFTLEAAEAVCAFGQAPVGDVLDGIASLTDKSLLWQEVGVDRERRFVLLETVREFGLEQLAASGEADEVADRHAAHFLALAERAAPEPPGPSGVPWLPVLDAEHPNLRAALTWLADHGAAAAFARLAAALWQFWYQHGHLGEGRWWLEQALVRAETVPPDLRVALLYKTGTLAHYQGDEARAVPLLEEGLTVARELGGTWATPYLLMTLGIVAVDQGRYAEAVPLLEEARTIFERLEYRSGAALSLGHLAAAAYGQGELARATLIGKEALELARALEDTWAAGLAQWFLALTGCTRGEHAAAAKYLTEMLAVDLEGGNRESIAHAFACFAVLATNCGQMEYAARLLGAAGVLREAVGAALALPERATYEEAETKARRALGAGAFSVGWLAGRALAPEEAVALTRGVTEAAMRFGASARAPALAGRHGLTSREMEIVRLVAAGRSNREIADQLFISLPTVKRHLTNVLGKLGLPSRSALNTYAHTHGLV